MFWAVFEYLVTIKGGQRQSINFPPDVIDKPVMTENGLPFHTESNSAFNVIKLCILLFKVLYEKLKVLLLIYNILLYSYVFMLSFGLGAQLKILF